MSQVRVILLLVIYTYLTYVTANKDVDIKYTVTPGLYPWGIQRTDANKDLWDKHVFRQNTPGLRLKFPSTADVDVVESHIWEIAGWSFKFIQLKKGKTYNIPKTGHLNHLTVHRGVLSDNLGNSYLQLMAPPKDVITTYINEKVKSVKAKEDTIFSLWLLDPNMSQHEVNTMIPEEFSSKRDITLKGLYSNMFEWVRFQEYFKLPVSFDADFFNLRGFEIYDSDNVRIMYAQFWTAGQGVNCGYHDHQDLTSETSYAELHLTLVYGGGGMQWYENGVEQPVLHLEEGYSHGPLFYTHDDWTPVRNNGVVSYPTHRWVNPGFNTTAANAYDLWVVFEYRDITSTAANI